MSARHPKEALEDVTAAPVEGAAVTWFSFDQRIDATRRGWRSELRRVLQHSQSPERSDDVLVATSELVSNSIEHGGGVARVHVLGQNGAVRVEVSDDEPSMSPLPSGDERGRGLEIVTALCDEWGWSSNARGKTTWAVFGPEDQDDDRRR